MPVKKQNDELMRAYRSRDFKTDNLDDTRTRLQHAQSYVHHLETELHKRVEQLEVS
jgi:hypothetical protein